MNYLSSRRTFLKNSGIFALPAALGIYPSLAEPQHPLLSSLPCKLSLNAYSFNKLLREGKIDLFNVLEFCAKHQFDAIDPTAYYFPGYPAVPSDEYLYRFKQQAFLLGLDISGTGIRNAFTDPDPVNRKKDIELIRQWTEAAAKMGIPHVRIFTGRPPHPGFSRDQVFTWMAEDMKACCEFGATLGVMISLQNHNEFLKTADEVNRMMEMVDSKWFGLNLDIGSYREKDPYEEIQRNIHHAITWQIKENVWINGKQVPTDFVKLFRIIKASDYRGYLPLETLGAGDPFEKVPRLLQQVKEAMEQV